MDRWVDELMDGWVGGHMGGQMDGRTDGSFPPGNAFQRPAHPSSDPPVTAEGCPQDSGAGGGTGTAVARPSPTLGWPQGGGRRAAGFGDHRVRLPPREPAGGEHPLDPKKPLFFGFPPSKTLKYFKRRSILEPGGVSVSPRGSVPSRRLFLSGTALPKRTFPSPISTPTPCTRPLLASIFTLPPSKIHQEKFWPGRGGFFLWAPPLKRGLIKWDGGFRELWDRDLAAHGWGGTTMGPPPPTPKSLVGS